MMPAPAGRCHDPHNAIGCALPGDFALKAAPALEIAEVRALPE
jgi:hypothetical protein